MYHQKYLKYKNKYLKSPMQSGGTTINDRMRLYYELNTKLSYLSNDEIYNLMLATKQNVKGFGTNAILELGDDKIFVKTIRITDREYNNLFDSSNLFKLPPYYNYGIGSYGFNGFRELLMHVKTTNFVLDGESENFPLMYHYRIIKNLPITIQKSEEYIDNYKKKMG